MVTRLNRIAILSLLISLVACDTVPVVSSAGYYGAKPGTQKVKGSYGQSIRRFIVDYDAADVRHAAKKSLGLDAVFIDVERKNMLSGVGHWVPPGFTGGCQPDQVVAIYTEKAGKRKTSVTVIVDHLSFCASGTNPESRLAQRVVSNLNTILATYD